MENIPSSISTFKELGIAGVAIGALLYVCILLVKQLAEARKNYESFVQDNNHTTTELVREATATIVEVRTTIEQHNRLTENNNRVMERLLDKI